MTYKELEKLPDDEKKNQLINYAQRIPCNLEKRTEFLLSLCGKYNSDNKELIEFNKASIDGKIPNHVIETISSLFCINVETL